jgi:unsaturated rhamnogalacturonyl hydrolase
MAGEDTTSSTLEDPALTPLNPDQLSTAQLHELASRIISATWSAGLPQWSWGEGVYLLNEIRYYESQGLEVPRQFIQWFANREAITSGHINNVAPGAAGARLNALGLFDASAISSSLEKWIADPKSATRAPNGAVEHWPGGVWADTCYMMGTFMLNQGVATKNSDMVEFIGVQLVKHIELLQNPTTHLFAHGSHRGETLWSYWGRGNSWMAISCIEYLDACRALDLTFNEIPTIKNALKAQLLALIPLLPGYGIWDVLVDHQVENAGILETSATAGIGSAMIRAAHYFPDIKEELITVGRTASAAALTYIDKSGVLTRTSAGTVLQLIPFGYSVIRSDRMQLWGQGLALAAITALLSPEANLLEFKGA